MQLKLAQNHDFCLNLLSVGIRDVCHHHMTAAVHVVVTAFPWSHGSETAFLLISGLHVGLSPGVVCSN